MNYRTEETPSESENVSNNHAYEYDANGNLVYVNTSRTKKDGMTDEKTAERKLKWDEENRLLASDDNGFVTNYWYDADGERTVKTSGESDQVYVNSEFAGGRTNTAKFSLYVSPYLVANQGGRYTKHIYIGSQRIVSKIGDFDSYGSDPRRIQYAGSETDGLSVDYKGKYAEQLQVIKDNYATFAVPYNGEDNNDYVDGKGFCCNDGSLEAVQAQALARAAKNNFQEGDAYEKMQFYYHPDHLGSSSYITNLDGEVVQHIEYVPFGEVFVEERNNIWNTPYLFNAKEFDEETGLYYYGARYYDPRLGAWISCDPLEENHYEISSYCYTGNNPVRYSDPTGEDWRDKVKGFGAAIIDNATGGITNIRSWAGKHVNDPTDFNVGLTVGDLTSLSIGTWESGTGASMIAGGSTVTTIGLVAEAPSAGTSTVVVGAGGAISTTGVALAAHGTVMMANAGKNLANKKGHINANSSNSTQKSSQPKGTGKNTVTFTQGKGSKATRIKTSIPDGYRKIKDLSHGNPVYTNGKNYITPDVDGHNGGIWKMGKSVKALQNKETRMGTYNANLKRIGD